MGTARLVARQEQAVTSGTRSTRCTACASSGLGALPTQRYCTTEARTTYHGTMALSSTMQPHLIFISSSSHAPAFRKEGPGTRMPTLRPKTWTPSRVGKSLRLPHTIKECIIEIRSGYAHAQALLPLCLPVFYSLLALSSAAHTTSFRRLAF
jgi:hypothetical protein